MFEKSLFCVITTQAPTILIRSSSYLKLTKIAITSRMSSNFSQIRPLTAELSAFDCVKKKSIFSVVATLASLFSSGSSSFLQVTRITTISQMSSNQYFVLWPL